MSVTPMSTDPKKPAEAVSLDGFSTDALKARLGELRRYL